MAKRKGKGKRKNISQTDANNKESPAPFSVRDYPQAHASLATNGSKASLLGKRKAESKLKCLSGFIFMCNTKTKPECFWYRVFGLPAGRMEDVENVKKGTQLFLFDFDVKLLYGVYTATSQGKMNLEASAFGGRFPAQVSFAIYKECLPLPESAFRVAIKDNYEGSKFKPELTGRQVKDLLSLFQPLTAAPVAPMPQVATPLAMRPPALEDQFQPSVRLPPSQDPYLAAAQFGRAAPIVEPHPVQQRVLNWQHEFYGTAATMGHVHPTLENQGLAALNSMYYYAESQRSYLAEDNARIAQDRYPRYGAMQQMVPRDQFLNAAAGYYKTYPVAATSHVPPLVRHPHGKTEYDLQRENVAGYYPTYPTPATSNAPPLVHHPHGEREYDQQLENVAGYYPTYLTPATSHGPPLVPHSRGEREHDLLGEHVAGYYNPSYPVPTTSHGPPLVHRPHGERELDMQRENVAGYYAIYPIPATSQGPTLVHPHNQAPGRPDLPVSSRQVHSNYIMELE